MDELSAIDKQIDKTLRNTRGLLRLMKHIVLKYCYTCDLECGTACRYYFVKENVDKVAAFRDLLINMKSRRSSRLGGRE